MNIVFLNVLSEKWEEKYSELKKEFPEVNFSNSTDPEERSKVIETADAIVTGRLTEEELTNAKKIKAIFIPFTGTNNFPLQYIKRRNIILSNTHANAKYVAERAVTLALALLGKVVMFHNALIKGVWNRTDDDDHLWESIHGRRCGILGYGHIGRNIAKLLKAYECKITGFRKNISSEKDEYADVITSDLHYVIDNSDLVFVCLPLNAETKDLINSQILQKMKGKYIINVGRGATINEEALYNSLKSGILTGAALDVWYNYPGKKTEPVYPANFPFWELDNVILSPHKASSTPDAIAAMINDTAENIRAFILTGKPKEIVSQ
ncbi:MAG: NAD(P)-binding domain-containing protein [Ignavibacteria bacterium]|nr:NAD(P)-binding domain-containing protein [Ignavibacteria bacterium]